MKLDLGCGPIAAQGYHGVDIRAYESVDIIADLSCRWPFKDNSINRVRAWHVFEHLPDSIFTMSELYRVLKPGHQAEIEVPSTNGMGAFQDPTHKSFWNIRTFLYFSIHHHHGRIYNSNNWEVKMCSEITVLKESGEPIIRAIVEKV